MCCSHHPDRGSWRGSCRANCRDWVYVIILSACLVGGLSAFLLRKPLDPDAQQTLAVIETGSDDEVLEHRFKSWEEWKKHGGRPLRVWSESTCKRVFDGIADGMTHTDSDKRVCYLFFYLHDFVLMQKEHFDISKMCSDDQFDAISSRLNQYNANVDFLTDKLFIQKVLTPTGETAIQLVRTHVTP